jgi:hypothetical protein
MADSFALRRPVRELFPRKPVSSWLVIATLCVYLALCWLAYTAFVEPLFGNDDYFIAADSGTYFEAAREESAETGGYASQVNLGGSTLGPVIVAKIFRTQLGVAIFNCVLFAICIQASASIPGVKRRTFALLLMANALTLPSLMTLNKEILALAGVVLFAKYLYSERKSLWLLGAVFVFSTMARWQQTFFILIYMGLESRFSPFRGKPKRAIAAVLGSISIAWALIASRFPTLLAAYMALAGLINQGTLARLNAIQAKGGFFVVVWPKILMNIGGRLLGTSYILHDWIHEDFHNLQNSVIGNLHSLVFLALMAFMLIRGRFRLKRPLVFFALIYMIFTAASPFIQNRYEYPAYVLLALEMSRRKESLEPTEPLPRPPALPPSYRIYAGQRSEA